MQPDTATRIARLVRSSSARPHGTRARYLGGCKCMLCRAANSRYSVARQAEVDAGNRNDLVSSASARRHIRELGKQGVGYKSVAAAASVATSIVMKILNGIRTQIRLATEQRILAVDNSAIADHALIPASPTWKILDALVAEGYTKRQIAKWLGVGNSIQFRRDWITAKSAAKVERMARLLNAGKLRRDR